MNKFVNIFKNIFKIKNISKKPKGLILGKIYDLSDKVIRYGSDLQTASREKYYIPESTWMPLTRSVLEKLHESAITYHRSTICLAENGWAQNVNPLLRTMIELIVNCGVIVEGDCEMRSFRYLVFELLKLDLTPGDHERSKRELKEQLFSHLDESNRKKAEEYLNKQKLGLYWYSGIYEGPRDVLKKRAPSLLDAYSLGSSASHGGQVGYKFFDENANLKDINPRKDPYSANLSIVFSIRLLLEFSLTRESFEKLGLEHYYHKYLKELIILKDLVQETRLDRDLFK